MNAWRTTISTDAAEGVGWCVDGPESLDWNAYYALGTDQYYAQHDKGWWPAPNAIANRMAGGDLCWTRDWHGNYHLRRVAGPSRYVATPEHADADIVNVRPRHWTPAGTVDSVPGKVLNSFRAGETLQAVYDDTVGFHSKLRFNRGGGTPPYDLAAGGPGDGLFALQRRTGDGQRRYRVVAEASQLPDGGRVMREGRLIPPSFLTRLPHAN